MRYGRGRGRTLLFLIIFVTALVRLMTAVARADSHTPTFVGIGNGTTQPSIAGTPVTINAPTPASLQENDLIVAWSHHKEVATLTADDTGWQIGTLYQDWPVSDHSSSWWWRFATSSEPATYAFTYTHPTTANQYGGVRIAAYRGADLTTPIDLFDHAKAGSANTLTTPALTSPGPNRLLLLFGTGQIGGSITSHPAGMTVRADDANNIAYRWNLWDEPVGEGSTGTRSISWGSLASRIAFVALINPYVEPEPEPSPSPSPEPEPSPSPEPDPEPDEDTSCNWEHGGIAEVTPTACAYSPLSNFATQTELGIGLLLFVGTVHVVRQFRVKRGTQL